MNNLIDWEYYNSHFPKVKEETIAYSTSIEDLFEKEGHFYTSSGR